MSKCLLWFHWANRFTPRPAHCWKSRCFYLMNMLVHRWSQHGMWALMIQFLLLKVQDRTINRDRTNSRTQSSAVELLPDSTKRQWDKYKVLILSHEVIGSVHLTNTNMNLQLEETRICPTEPFPLTRFQSQTVNGGGTTVSCPHESLLSAESLIVFLSGVLITDTPPPPGLHVRCLQHFLI